MPRLSLIAVLVALVAVGCGGGSGETTTHGKTRTDVGPAQPDFVSLADTICANHRSRQEDLESQARELGPNISATEARGIAALLRQEAANRRNEVRELEALPTSSLRQMKAATVFPLIRAEAKVIDTWAAAYDDLDGEGIRRLQLRLAAITATTAARARKYGFDVCGRS